MSEPARSVLIAASTPIEMLVRPRSDPRRYYGIVEADAGELGAAIPEGGRGACRAGPGANKRWWHPGTATVWVSNKSGGSETVVDAASGRAVATLAVGADTGNVVFDASTRQMVVAVGQSNELVLIDAGGTTISRRLPLPGCRGAHALAVTAATVLVTCEDSAKVVAVDLGSGRTSGTGSTGATPDVLAFDSARERLYVAAEDGVVAAFDTQGGGLALRGKVKVANGAHTVAVDPTTRQVYLPLPSIGGHPGSSSSSCGSLIGVST